MGSDEFLALTMNSSFCLAVGRGISKESKGLYVYLDS